MAILINKFTKLFISISAKPGSTGSLLHNTGYKLMKLNCIYIPFKFKNLKNFRLMISKFNIKGCSVSMPFKQSVVKLLDLRDESVKKTDVANTVVVKNNKLKGYNTDYYSTNLILNKIKLRKYDSVLLIGNGGIAKTIYTCIKNTKVEKIFLCARDRSKYKKWKVSKRCIIIPWNKRNLMSAALLVNATPIGMTNNALPVKKNCIKNFRCILDLVINNKSSIKSIAKRQKIRFFGGLEFSFYQGCKQFEIYTNKKLNQTQLKQELGYRFN